jgi:hypothetical protein
MSEGSTDYDRTMMTDNERLVIPSCSASIWGEKVKGTMTKFRVGFQL